MKIIKLFLFISLVNNFSKIEKISDLNSIGIFRWDDEVTGNQNKKKDIIDVLNKITAKEYLEQTSNITAFLLKVTGAKDSHIREALDNIFKNATELEKNTLQSKIYQTAGMILLLPVAGYAAMFGLFLIVGYWYGYLPLQG